ncbi:hypothetical protein FBU30_001700 [Linnemannia zychae]|nr:hypothetical protein FBU30_001700 [Linnemannia zychae]
MDGPLEFVKTAPILDPKVPFFKYLDMLTTISKNALNLHHQAYELFLALNPQLAYRSISKPDQAVKTNKKVEALLKSSMILLQRYCLIIQISLPRLPSFRRRTFNSALRAYQTNATYYMENLRHYQINGTLLYLQSYATQPNKDKQDEKRAKSRTTDDIIALGEFSTAKVLSNIPIHPNSTAQVPELSENLVLTSPVIPEQQPTIEKQTSMSIPTIKAPVASLLIRRTSSRWNKKDSLKSSVKVEKSHLNVKLPSIVTSSKELAKTDSALWKIEKDLERLKNVGIALEEELARNNHIRSNIRLLSRTTTSAPSDIVPTSASSIATNPISNTHVAAKAAVAEPSNSIRTHLSTYSVVEIADPTLSERRLSTSHKSLASRTATFVAQSLKESKSTTESNSPVVSRPIRNTGVVRNLIRHYETPSSSSSTSSQSNRLDPMLNGGRKSAVAAVSIEATETPTVHELTTKTQENSLKIEQLATTTTPTPTTVTIASRTPATIAALGLCSISRKNALPDLGDKQACISVSLSRHPSQKAIQDTTCNREGPIGNESNPSGSSKSVIPKLNTSASTSSYSLSKAQSAIAKSALILKDSQTMENPTKFRVSINPPCVKIVSQQDSGLKGPRISISSSSSPLEPLPVSSMNLTTVQNVSNKGIKTDSLNIDEKHSMQTSTHQNHMKPSLATSNLWANPRPPLGQTRTVSSSPIDAVTTRSSVATGFRARTESKSMAELGPSTSVPSNPQPGPKSMTVADVSEINLSNRPSPVSVSAKPMSSDESIRSWRRSVLCTFKDEANMSVEVDPLVINRCSLTGPSDNRSTVENNNEMDNKNHLGNDKDDDDDDRSYIDLIRIPTMSSTRSAKSVSATRTSSFSASSPLGSARFKRQDRPNFSGSLIKEIKRELEATDVHQPQGVKEVKKKSAYVPESDESDTETVNLEYLEVSPARDTQEWLEMRAREREQERENEILRRRYEENTDESENIHEEYTVPIQLMRTRLRSSNLIEKRLLETESKSQPCFIPSRSQHQFHSPSSSRDQGMTRYTPSSTKPIQPKPFCSTRQKYYEVMENSLKNDSKPQLHYNSSNSTTSTCTVRQLSPSCSISPAPSAFESLKATSPQIRITPSLKSFATGSTVDLQTPKFFPSSSIAASSVRSLCLTTAQTGNEPSLSAVSSGSDIQTRETKK